MAASSAGAPNIGAPEVPAAPATDRIEATLVPHRHHVRVVLHSGAQWARNEITWEAQRLPLLDHGEWFLRWDAGDRAVFSHRRIVRTGRLSMAMMFSGMMRGELQLVIWW